MVHIFNAKRAGGQVARRIRRLPLPEPRRPRDDDFNAPLYTFKAFAIATAIVFSTASASVAGVMTYLDVHNTTDFAAHMRKWVALTMPRLTAKIYRRPTALDTVDPDDPVLHVAPTPPLTPSTFDHDAAQERLADAFDRGGFDAWVETAARELEVEIEVERARKQPTS